MHKASVVVITRNRHRDLLHCLGSLISQMEKPDEVLIIDNNSTDRTEEIVKNFQEAIGFPIRCVKEKKIGYASARNRGLKESNFPWVAFIDDDCVADENWFLEVKKSIRNMNSSAAILGRCLTLYHEKMPSKVQNYLDSSWKNTARNKKVIFDFEILDTKNIVFNKIFLEANKIEFDERGLVAGGGVSEDCDLGMQIQKKGGKAMYNEKMIVHHKDAISWYAYYDKLFSTIKNHKDYVKKWREFRQKNTVLSNSGQQGLAFLWDYIVRSDMNVLRKVTFCIHVLVSVSIIKVSKSEILLN